MLQEIFGAAAESMGPKEDPYLNDPVSWVRHKCKEELWSIQREVALSVLENRYTAVPSCHDSGKSYLASRLVGWWMDVHPAGEAFAVTTAPTTHQVGAILWREIRRVHKKADLRGRITLDNRWRMPSVGDDELVAYGRKPQDYDPDAFQGIHQRYVLVVIDEANGVPKALFDAVDSIVTNVHARVLAIGNPDNPASHFAKICAPGSGWHTIHIDGYKTPNFTDEWVPAEIRDLLLSPTWVEERKKRWGIRSPLFVSKVRGEFPKVAGDTLIFPEWIERAMKREILPHPSNPGQLGCDVARYGDDETIVMRQRDGHVRCEFQHWMAATTETTGHLANAIKRFQPDADNNKELAQMQAPAVVDEVGVGAGVVDNLKEMGLEVEGFNGGWQAQDTERFFNARAEAYWNLREQFEADLVDMDPDDEQLAAELGNLKWTVDSKGRIKLETKDEYRKRTHASSPDRADAVCYAFVPFGQSIDLGAHTSGQTLTGDLLNLQM